MQERHKNREQYYKEQGITTAKYLIPYVERYIPITSESRILEVGCGFAGNLSPFIERGCEVVGIDLGEHLIELGKKFLAKNYPDANATLVCSDIYDTDAATFGTFD
ncbi:MAG: class I SAM-dependent methyltransferase, partial [Bacteroidota bacterium]